MYSDKNIMYFHAYVTKLLIVVTTAFLILISAEGSSESPTSSNTFLPAAPLASSAHNSSNNFVNKTSSYSECHGNCSSLPAPCYQCQTNNSCTYGFTASFPCTVKDDVECNGERTMLIDFQCIYCFLTKVNEEHVCTQTNTSCRVNATPPERVKGECAVKERVFCLGQRNFTKMMPCSWTAGYSWSTAFTLSITVGGFGIDRFYLGYWREGLGKVFSFGGLGVWTLIDAALIGSGYLGPADGSLYVP